MQSLGYVFGNIKNGLKKKKKEKKRQNRPVLMNELYIYIYKKINLELYYNWNFSFKYGQHLKMPKSRCLSKVTRNSDEEENENEYCVVVFLVTVCFPYVLARVQN